MGRLPPHSLIQQELTGLLLRRRCSPVLALLAHGGGERCCGRGGLGLKAANVEGWHCRGRGGRSWRLALFQGKGGGPPGEENK
jgi:hypothetical protein